MTAQPSAEPCGCQSVWITPTQLNVTICAEHVQSLGPRASTLAASKEINHFEHAPDGVIDWKMEAERANRLHAQAEKTIDTLDSNARVQAKLLADTGRERDELRHQVEGMRAYLESYEQWEAALIMDNKCWIGMNCQFTDELWNRMIEIQEKRNLLLGRFSHPSTQSKQG